ncbi:MAG: type II secretion system F family protein [Deltaproteobacteria bacterium]|nr:type II secretion system F family protein [Deltaproteobacteria bacterium]
MNAADFIPVGLLLFPGSVILLRFGKRAMIPGRIRWIAEGVESFHEGSTGWLLKKGVFRFPGAHLVTSPRGWFCGESVLLAAAALSIGGKYSFSEAAFVMFLGSISAAAAVYLSFREEARRRIDAIRAALPVAAFLMSLMLEAGMGSSAALQEVVRALPRGPLAAELDELARARLLGMSRADAIERSRSRVPLDDYRAFLNLVQQGERLGIALSQGLRELSSRMMESQAHRAETIAQKAAVKLLFPLVIFIFPSVFIVILSPVILNLFDMLRR